LIEKTDKYKRGIVYFKNLKELMMMNKSDIYSYLDNCKIEYEITEHKAVFNMAELEEVDLLYPDCQGKNLFVRDKKRNYYLITVKGDKRINLKEFAQNYGLKSLSFACHDDLMKLLRLDPGSVTPFGLLNDLNNEVKLFIDENFKGGLIGVHPNDNTATIWLKTEDMIRLIKEHGNEVISIVI
jgi:Ala-tRNA(Pro) deacylase